MLTLTKLERDWRTIICKELRAQNALVFAIVAHKRQEPGWPDIYIHHSYIEAVHIEFKGTNTAVAAKQDKIVRELNRRRPATAFFARHSPSQQYRNKGYLFTPMRNGGESKFGEFVNGGELLTLIAELQKKFHTNI